MKSLEFFKNASLVGETCILRVDLNIEGADLHRYEHGLTRIPPFRIAAVLPTIEFLTGRGAKVVILSHRGRPSKILNFKFSPFGRSPAGRQISNFSLRPFAKIFSRLLKRKVHFLNFGNLRKSDFLRLKNTMGGAAPGSVFLLENLRFFPGEDKNNIRLAKQLTSLGTFYVNDAFAFSHRKTASMVAIAKFLPSYAGLLLEKEIKNLSLVMNPFDKAQGSRRVYRGVKKPKKPLVIILGGAKISDKLGLIKNFLKRTDYFLIGGGIANTFVAAQGLPVGNSLYEKEMIPMAKKLLKSKKIMLPVDFEIANRKILDIGPKTAKSYATIIKRAKTIIWNGPMGYIEDRKFRKGSEAIIKAIFQSRAFSVIGGGETTSLFTLTNTDYTRTDTEISRYKSVLSPRKSVFLSTGGGAMLEFLAGKKLPGIEALKTK